ncbi:hypothetical protein LC1Hm_2373 [Halomicrobium sp. LC1Hm]|nr:hypothetical protein LC1Hm_2373 [Halomicrobium sp. LC1Hm]
MSDHSPGRVLKIRLPIDDRSPSETPTGTRQQTGPAEGQRANRGRRRQGQVLCATLSVSVQ